MKRDEKSSHNGGFKYDLMMISDSGLLLLGHPVHSHPSVSGGATAKSLEGTVIGMGFTIGIPSISQWRVFTGVDQELCKRGVA